MILGTVHTHATKNIATVNIIDGPYAIGDTSIVLDYKLTDLNKVFNGVYFISGTGGNFPLQIGALLEEDTVNDKYTYGIVGSLVVTQNNAEVNIFQILESKRLEDVVTIAQAKKIALDTLLACFPEQPDPITIPNDFPPNTNTYEMPSLKGRSFFLFRDGIYLPEGDRWNPLLDGGWELIIPGDIIEPGQVYSVVLAIQPWATSIKGAPGADGAAGASGAAGPAGAPGTPGNTIHYGSGVPSNSLGINNDAYIDVAANTLYAPKTAGVWPSPVSMSVANTVFGVSPTFTGDGQTSSFSWNHGLGFDPTTTAFTIDSQTSAGLGIYSKTANATQFTVAYDVCPVGTIYYNTSAKKP